MKSSLPIPTRLRSKLSSFRRRVWMVKLAEGLLASVFGLGFSYLLVMGLDRIIDTPAWLRGLLLVAGAAIPGLGLPLKWHRWVWRQRRLEDAARLLRWKFPMLGDQLLGIVELAKADSVTGRSERLVEAAMDQADEAVVDLDFSDAVPKASHWRWGFAAVAACLLIATGFLAINEAAKNALARWLMPWKETERYTFARVEELPNPLVVPVAEPFELPLSLSDDTRWEPGKASGKIRGQDSVRAESASGDYALSFPPQTEDSKISVKVGDVRETIRLEPRTRPELETLVVRMELPDYLQYETKPEIEVRGGSVSVLQGAKASFKAKVSRGLAHAEIDGKPVEFTGNEFTSLPNEEASERDVTFTWEDELGLRPQEPLVMKIRPIEDEAPRLLARRDSLEQVVLVSEVVPFDISASDDFGIQSVGLEWKGRDSNDRIETEIADGSKVASAGAPETKELEARATFSAEREGIEPQTIEIRAWAEDYLSGRDRSVSSTFVLHILSADDHAMWVTQQMARWLDAAKETYEREQRLHETNKEFRELSVAELDRPDKRREIAAQASAETANGERLTSLTDSGKKLVDHATKNDEFDAERLESWALMLRSLEDIAKNRMPNVADLLKQAADAEAGAPGEPSEGGKPELASGESGDPKGGAPAGEPSSEPGKPGKPGESSTAQNPPSKEKGQPGEPSSPSGEEAPKLTAGPDSPKGESGPKEPGDPDAEKPKSDPSIALKESTMFKPEPGSDEPQPEAPPSGAKLKLPTVTMAAPPKKFKQPPPPCPAGTKLDEGIEEQRDLLAEFAKVSDQLNEILASLESSTFVKRFKAASRQQTQLAGDLGVKSLEGFGIDRESIDAPEPKPEPKPAPEKIPEPEPAKVAIKEETEPEIPFVTTFAPIASNKAKTESDVVQVILSDLEAYFQRKADLHVKKVIGEMKDTDVVQELDRVGSRAADNYSGNAIHAAELWADTMDRWGEEMVAVGKAFC